MRIGILEAGQNRDMLERRHGAYSDMFQALLSPHDPSLTFVSYAAFDGILPDSADECDAWIVTGSRDTAFERLAWMVRLEDFLREAMAKGRPIAGICFGHQILAQAMGGAVERAAAGWGLGIHSYDTIAPLPAWMVDAPKTVSLSAVHRDQVTRLPPQARIVASSPFCPAAILAYGDQAITFQGHPEFSVDFVRDLLDELAQKDLDEDVDEDVIARARADLHSAQAHTDSPLVARWILTFFDDRYRKGSPS